MAARLSWGAAVASRPCAVALCVLAALSVRASAQTPPAPTQPAATPETPAADAPATNPQAAAPPAPSDTTVLPTIDVSAPRSPPQAQPNVAPRQAAPVPTPAPAPPSPYQTGAPNVAGGTPVVPQMASQMVISGANLNSRPVSESAEILEAAPGLAVVQHSGSGKANQYYLGGYNRPRHRHGDLLG
jgi:hypothetical protein